MHAASDPRGDPWQVDVAGTRRLVQAVDRDRLRHLVYVSIVGVDRIPYGYYRAKFAAEQVLLASGPAGHAAARHPVPRLRRRAARHGPARAGAAGAHGLAGAAGRRRRRRRSISRDGLRRAPAGGVVEFGGPEELTAADLARAWAAARAPSAHVVATPVPGRMSAAFRDGAALPTGGERGRRTYGRAPARLSRDRAAPARLAADRPPEATSMTGNRRKPSVPAA